MGFLDNVRRFVLPAEYENAAVDSMHQADKFTPGVPLAPADGYSRVPRAHDFLTGYNIAARPRRNERVSFVTLRGLIDAYDIAQMAITHRIDSVRSLDWYLEPIEGYEGDLKEEIASATRILKRPDHELPFRAWLSKYLWDILCYDAGTLYRMRNNAGRAIGLRVIDGTTIAPMIDYHGNRPRGEAPAYVQFAQGVPWNWLTDEDIIYVPFRPMPNSPYGKAPLESILLNANTDLRFQNYFLSRFTEGTVPEGFATAPESWGPDQIADFQDGWDAMMYGDDSKKHQIKWVPGGTNFTWSQENPFSSEFSLFLMRKTAAAFHVTPNDLGFTDTVNLANGETQTEVQFRVGDLPLVQHVQDVLTDFIQTDLGYPLNFVFNVGGEKDDRLMSAQIAQIMINSGVLSPSEVRQDTYGLQEPEGAVIPRFINSGQGPIPIANLLGIAGPVDPDVGMPVDGNEISTFTPAEGVLAPPAQPMVKEGETAGITSETGVYGTPVVGTAENPLDDDLEEITPEQEMEAFKRFKKARKKDGKWRDFSFHSVPEDLAQRLNVEARASIEGGEVSLMVVYAKDTGRVLMIQRAMDSSDPHAGKLDFPGGHIEVGETTLDAAVREWHEEVGVDLPDGDLRYGWRCESTDHTHVAFVLEISEEAMIIPRSKRDQKPSSADDLDQGHASSVLWVSPADLPNNPMVKHDLQVAMDQITSAVGDAFSHGGRLA